MAIEIKAPTFPESVQEGTLATWHKNVGDSVTRDELIVDIETRMTSVLRALGRMAEADEIDRRLVAVLEAMEDVPVSDDLGD